MLSENFTLICHDFWLRRFGVKLTEFGRKRTHSVSDLKHV